MIEVIKKLGASGLVAMPTEADLNGPLSEEINKYYQSARLEAADRIPLFRLAWDTALSAFAVCAIVDRSTFSWLTWLG